MVVSFVTSLPLPLSWITGSLCFSRSKKQASNCMSAERNRNPHNWFHQPRRPYSSPTTFSLTRKMKSESGKRIYLQGSGFKNVVNALSLGFRTYISIRVIHHDPSVGSTSCWTMSILSELSGGLSRGYVVCSCKALLSDSGA